MQTSKAKRSFSLFLAIMLAVSVVFGYLPMQKLTVSAEAGTTTADLTPYDMEGYAKATGVTGGGVIDENAANYYKVSTSEELAKLLCRKNPDTDKVWTGSRVIEITQDIDMGWNLLSATARGYSSVKTAVSPKTHPWLKASGMTIVYLEEQKDLTIYSKYGAEIKHANFVVKGGSKNLMFRNLKFSEAWEWDDSGDYDGNDWDYFTLEGATDSVWIDHCTFDKAYDGIIDVKKASKNVTISWCKFLDGSGPFFDAMMDYLEANKSSFTNYNKARTNGVSFDQMKVYASGQKKTHLLGHSDSESGDAAIRVTLANNYYKNPMDRLPRLRFGKAHVYNTYVDATDLAALKTAVGSKFPSNLKISSNGAISACGGSILMENCYIKDMNIPLRNNNTNPSKHELDGDVVALNTRYIAANVSRSWDDYPSVPTLSYTNVNILGNSTDTGSPMASWPEATSFDTGAFKSELGYSYNLYDPDSLSANLPLMGANALAMTGVQWMKTAYSTSETVPDTLPTAPVVKNVTLGNVTVTGTKGTELASTSEIVIDITNDTFNAIVQGADLKSWITNLPAGLTAVAKNTVNQNATQVTITVGGTPTATSSASILVTIPAAALVGGANIMAKINTSAKYAITAPTGGGTGGTGGGTGDKYEYSVAPSVNTSNYFTNTGNANTGGSAHSYNGTNYTKGLKMESSTVLSFTTATDGATLTIVANADKASSTVKLNGDNTKITDLPIQSVNGAVEKTVVLGAAGQYKIEKGTNQGFIYYVSVTEAGGNTGGGDDDEPEAIGAKSISITAPVSGQDAQTDLTTATEYAGEISWFSVTDDDSHSGTFYPSSVYKAIVTLTSKEGYIWPETPPTITVPGQTVDNVQVFGDESGNILTFDVTFPQTLSTTVLNISNVPTATIGAGTAMYFNGFAVLGGSSMSISSDTKSIDGLNFTKRLSLGGAADFSAKTRAIKFEVSASSTVVVYTISSSSSTNRDLVISNGSEVIATQTSLGSAVSKVTYNIPEAGTYYLGSGNGGIYVYYISVTDLIPIVPQTITPSTYDTTAIVGTPITSTDGFYKANSGGTAGTHTYQWKRADNIDRTGNVTDLDTTKDYTPVQADFGKYIWLETTPVGSAGMLGVAVKGAVLRVGVVLNIVIAGEVAASDAKVNSAAVGSGVTVYGQANIEVTTTGVVDWSSDESGTFGDASLASTTYTPTGASGAVTLTATTSLQATLHAVTYVLNGGSGTAPTETSKTHGATFAAALPTGLTAPEGKEFKEWHTSSDGLVGTAYAAGATVTMPGHDLILYAIWENIPAIRYTITYDANGGSGTVPTETPKGEGSVFAAANPTGLTAPAGMRFKAWNTAANGSGISYSPGVTVTMSAADLTLYAIWEDTTTVKYTITYDLNGGSGTAPTELPKGEGDVFAAADSTGLTAPEGLRFKQWNTKSDGTGTAYAANSTVTVLAGNLTLYAIWEPIPSGFSISIGNEQAGGVGVTREITIATSGTASTTGKYLIVKVTEGSGANAKVIITMISLTGTTDTVTISYPTSGSTVEVWITSTFNLTNAEGPDVLAFAKDPD